MYLDFEDYRPDIQPIGSAISWREGVLLSIIVHLLGVIVLILVPDLFPFEPRAQQQALVNPDRPEDATRFVFVQPRSDLRAPRPPDRGNASDKDRLSRAPDQAPKPRDPEPFARGNSPERIESVEQTVARPQGPRPDPEEGRQQAGLPDPQSEDGAQTSLPESQSALKMPTVRPPAAQNGGRALTPGGGLGDALRNLQRYVQRESWDNPQGGGGQFGPEIQFDTKGVEFGPWVRRFVAQVKRNWLPMIPYSAMMYKGHVVMTFNVHKDGSITDLTVAGPSAVNEFNTAAFGSLKASNPTEPLPREYPTDAAFFTVTFFYNEAPPR